VDILVRCGSYSPTCYITNQKLFHIASSAKSTTISRSVTKSTFSTLVLSGTATSVIEYESTSKTTTSKTVIPTTQQMTSIASSKAIAPTTNQAETRGNPTSTYDELTQQSTVSTNTVPPTSYIPSTTKHTPAAQTQGGI